MQLVQAGKIDLDADVNKYIDFTIPPYEGKPVTMRNLMTHSAGFEETVRDLLVDRQDQVLADRRVSETPLTDPNLSAGQGHRLFELRRDASGLHRPAHFGREV